MGPGKYDLDGGKQIGGENANKAGIVSFKHMLHWDDVVGNKGEKPLNSKIPLEELTNEHYYEDTVLDIDRAAATDAATQSRNNGIILYRHVRLVFIIIVIIIMLPIYLYWFEP